MRKNISAQRLEIKRLSELEAKTVRSINGTKYSRVDQVNFVEDSL